VWLWGWILTDHPLSIVTIGYLQMRSLLLTRSRALGAGGEGGVEAEEGGGEEDCRLIKEILEEQCGGREVLKHRY